MRVMGRDEKKYNAFISYSRKTDLYFSEKLQDHLHRFAKPWYKARTLRVFRDKTNIKPSTSIGSELKNAIDDSAFFILIASPGSASSEWVNNEVDYWFEGHTTERLIIILTGGSIVWNPGGKDFDWNRTDALPAALSNRFQSEPLYIDASWYRVDSTALSLKNKDFFDLVKTVSATILQIDKDLLADQYRKQQVISIAVFTSLAVLMIIAAGTSLVFKKLSDDNKALAQTNYRLAQTENSLSAARNAEMLIAQGYPNKALENLIEVLPKDVNSQDRPYVTEVEAQFYNYLKRTAPSSAYYCLSDEQEGYFTKDMSILSFDVSPKGKYFAVATEEKFSAIEGPARYTIAIHNLEQKNVSYRYITTEESASPERLFFNSDGGILIAALRNGSIRVVDTATSSVLNEYFLADDINRVLPCPDTDRCLCISRGGNFIFDIRSGRRIVNFQPYDEIIVQGISSSTGERFAGLAGFSQNNAVLYDATTGSIIAKVNGDASLGEKDALSGEAVGNERLEEVESPFVSFNRDGRFFVTLLADGKIRVLLAETGELYHVVDDGAVHVDISPDGKLLLGAMKDRTAKIWDLETKEVLHVLRGHAKGLIKAVFSPDGQSVLTLSRDRVVKLWNPKTGRFITGVRNYITDAAFSPDGDYLVTVSGGFRGSDNAARVWDAHTGSFERFVASGWHEDHVSYADFTGDGRHLVYLMANWSMPDDLCALDYRRDNIVAQVLDSHIASAGSLALRGDGKRLLAGYNGNEYWLWDIDHDQGRVLRKLTPGKGSECRGEKKEGAGGQKVLFGPHGNYLAVLSGSCPPEIYDAETGELFYKLKLDEGPVNDLNFSSDEKNIVTAHESGATVVWDARKGEVTAVYRESVRYSENRRISQAHFSPDGTKLMLVGDYGTALIDANDGRVLEDFLFDLPVEYNMFSRDSRYLITSYESSLDSKVTYVWDIIEEKYITTHPYAYMKSQHAIAENKPYLALWSETGGSGGINRLITIIDYLTGEQIQEIRYGLEPDELGNLAISANGEHVLISQPAEVSVWKVGTGKKIMAYSLEDDVVVNALMSANGEQIAVAGQSGKIVILDIYPSTQDLITAFK